MVRIGRATEWNKNRFGGSCRRMFATTGIGGLSFVAMVTILLPRILGDDTAIAHGPIHGQRPQEGQIILITMQRWLVRCGIGDRTWFRQIFDRVLWLQHGMVEKYRLTLR